MIITADKEVWYNSLVTEHERRAGATREDSGARQAENVIVDELKQMQYDRSLRLTTQQALTLLSARIAASLHQMANCTSFDNAKREVFCRFLAEHAKKIRRETPLSIFHSVQCYVFSGQYLTPIQGFCLGLFVQFCTEDGNYRDIRVLVTQVDMRSWLIGRIDYYETLGDRFTFQQRQEAIDAFLFILGLFH